MAKIEQFPEAEFQKGLTQSAEDTRLAQIRTAIAVAPFLSFRELDMASSGIAQSYEVAKRVAEGREHVSFRDLVAGFPGGELIAHENGHPLHGLATPVMGK